MIPTDRSGMLAAIAESKAQVEVSSIREIPLSATASQSSQRNATKRVLAAAAEVSLFIDQRDKSRRMMHLYLLSQGASQA